MKVYGTIVGPILAAVSHIRNNEVDGVDWFTLFCHDMFVRVNLFLQCHRQLFEILSLPRPEWRMLTYEFLFLFELACYHLELQGRQTSTTPTTLIGINNLPSPRIMKKSSTPQKSCTPSAYGVRLQVCRVSRLTTMWSSFFDDPSSNQLLVNNSGIR